MGKMNPKVWEKTHKQSEDQVVEQTGCERGSKAQDAEQAFGNENTHQRVVSGLGKPGSTHYK
jgi:hypothetical protein